jgi:hypothetical protein
LLKLEKAETEHENKAPRVLRQLPASGPLLLGAFLRFPAETVQPLNAGLAKLLGSPHLSVFLNAMAREAKTARVLEAALAPSSAVLPKLRAKLVRAFKGLLGSLAPHHIGGWVCASLWRASLSDTQTREAFAQELLAVEDRLRRENFAVWKVCGLNQAKLHGEVWQKQQEKAGKARRLFDSILLGADPELAKAAAVARQNAVEDEDERRAREDPIVAGLLPAPEVPELPTDVSSACRKRKHSAELGSEDQTASVTRDGTLDETLKLIAGKATLKRKRRSESMRKLLGSCGKNK